MRSSCSTNVGCCFSSKACEVDAERTRGKATIPVASLEAFSAESPTSPSWHRKSSVEEVVDELVVVQLSSAEASVQAFVSVNDSKKSLITFLDRICYMVKINN